MKNKRLWLSVTLTVLVVVCAMLILSRVNGHPDDGAARYEEV